MKILSLIWRKAAALILTAMLLSVIPVSGLTENDSFTEDPRYDVDFNRWGSAADRMDEYLDLAFELYLAGDTNAAFDCINNAYFSVYEATGFEQQTMTSISRSRKNDVEFALVACKRAVKNTEQDINTRRSVRTTLDQVKTLIREDANTLASLMEPAQPITSVTYWKNGVQVEKDPWAEMSGEKTKYSSWTEVAEAAAELIDTADAAFNDHDISDALTLIDCAYFEVYESSGFDREIYSVLGAEKRWEADSAFAALRTLALDAQENAKSRFVSRRSWKTACENLKTILREAAEETGHISQSK